MLFGCSASCWGLLLAFLCFLATSLHKNAPVHTVMQMSSQALVRGLKERGTSAFCPVPPWDFATVLLLLYFPSHYSIPVYDRSSEAILRRLQCEDTKLVLSLNSFFSDILPQPFTESSYKLLLVLFLWAEQTPLSKCFCFCLSCGLGFLFVCASMAVSKS